MSNINKEYTTSENIRIPVDLLRNEQGLFVVSLLLPRTYFREPFFIDSLAKSFNILKSEIKLSKEDELLVHPVHYDQNDKRVVYTPVNEFISEYSDEKIKKEVGFIFHMSRCGSTLMTQMLAQSDRFFVLSEPTIINAVLDPALIISPENRRALFRASMVMLIKCSPVMCERVFIKFRSWNTFFINLILTEFPDVRWMFVHRYGLEVLPSVMEKPPGWLRSRALYIEYFSNLLQIDVAIIRTMSQDEYVARLLGVFCKIAGDFGSDQSLFVDYNDLTKNFILNVSRLWNIRLTEKEKLDMDNVKSLYSKDVRKIIKFRPDNEEKRAKASENQIELVGRIVESERLKLTNTAS